MASGVAGCTSISYYAQSLKGHVEIMTARKDVGKLIHDPSTPRALRAKLTSASAIRRFATEELALPDNNSYRSYVDIGRDNVTLAVFAAPQMAGHIALGGSIVLSGILDRQRDAVISAYVGDRKST
ncbi:hypothetical protein EN871_33270, partial [bacterium M00.F.Ca.ET.228.01.1.1]